MGAGGAFSLSPFYLNRLTPPKFFRQKGEKLKVSEKNHFAPRMALRTRTCACTRELEERFGFSSETACFAINLWLEDEVVGFEPDEDFFPEE